MSAKESYVLWRVELVRVLILASQPHVEVVDTDCGSKRMEENRFRKDRGPCRNSERVGPLPRGFGQEEELRNTGDQQGLPFDENVTKYRRLLCSSSSPFYFKARYLQLRGHHILPQLLYSPSDIIKEQLR